MQLKEDPFKNIDRALRYFGSVGPHRDGAYSILYRDGREVLIRYLKHRSIPDEESEDIIQKLFVRILENWERLHFENGSAWYKYIHESVKNAIRSRKSGKTEEIKSDPEDPRAEILGGLWQRLGKERLYKTADYALLGQRPIDAELRRLAATYVYVDGKPTDVIFRSVIVKNAKAELSSEQDFESWISDVWVLRKIAFDQLYVPNDALTSLILGEKALDSSQLDSYVKQAKEMPPQSFAFGEWCWQEIDYVLLRFRAGIPQAHAIGKVVGNLTKERASEIHARCLESFPFVSCMGALWNRLDSNPNRKEALSKNNLWKRLVFQYHFAESLPQDHILERISAPAAISGYNLNNVNSWVAGRLEGDLRKWLQEEKTDESEG